MKTISISGENEDCQNSQENGKTGNIVKKSPEKKIDTVKQVNKVEGGKSKRRDVKHRMRTVNMQNMKQQVSC